MNPIPYGIVVLAIAATPVGIGTLQAQDRAELEKSVAYGLSLSDEAWLKLIPKQSRGIFWTTCPHCKIRTRTARWQWVPETPGVITCEDCQTRFPDSRYPEDGEIVVKAPEGGEHRFGYFQEPLPEAPDFRSLPRLWTQTWAEHDADKAWKLFPQDASGELYRWEISKGGEAATIHRKGTQSVTLSHALDNDLFKDTSAFYLEVELPLPSGDPEKAVELIFGLEPWIQVTWGKGGLILKGADRSIVLGGEGGRTETLRFLIRPGVSRIEAVWQNGKVVPLSEPLAVRNAKEAQPTLFLTAVAGSKGPVGIGKVELRPAPPGKGSAGEPTRYFLGMTAEYFARKYVVEQTAQLAELYKMTHEERLAKRIAITLEEFARVYPGYPYITDGSWHGKPTEFFPFDQPAIGRGNRPSRWDFWGYMDLSGELLTAFQAIEQWPGWNAQERVKSELFRRQIADVTRFPETYHNMSVARAWPNLLLAARILKDPALFHATYRKLERFMARDFLYDGYWKETSPSYAAMTNGGLLRIARYIEGYSDPEGYIDPVDHRRFDNLAADQALPGAAGLRDTLRAARFPDGRYLPINDTWGSSRPPGERQPVERTSGLFPGFGVALLQTSEGVPFSAYLNFSSGRMHKQYDTLSIGLYAQDKEYLSTIGYTHTRYRPWAKSAMSKNSVIVDGREPAMDPMHVGNRLVLFSGDSGKKPLFSLTAARSLTAYPKRTSRYERYLTLVGGAQNSPYLVDVFHVKGGKQHDYLLQSSVDEDSKAELEGLTLKPFSGSLMNPGARFVPPTIEGSNIGVEAGYAFIKNLKEHVAQSDGATLVFRYDAPERGLRSRLLSQEGDHYFLGERPSVRRAGGRHFKEDESLLDRDQAPVLCWRRKGENLESTFIAVHQLLKDTPIKVDRLSAPAGLIALRLDRGEGDVDYYLQNLETGTKAEISTPEGKITFEGRVGFLRLLQGDPKEARLIGKGSIEMDGRQLDQPNGEAHGTISGFGDTPEPYVDISERMTLPSAKHAMILTFPDGTERSFNVLNTTPHPSGVGTRVHVREQMGFTRGEGGIAFTSFPAREVKGDTITYTLPLMKTAHWEDAR